uniref:ATPbinding Cassette (ABC) Superfamily putative n=1 Tax=Albugo laibachii Nc14 TaxID=890382 RepID=F0WUA9_9STRA|nr:ATPbinding Cassette (ABC) Superfamily putative [Albugo laibachii Nc14]CCA26515.1 ATPbinding Cassette (ABC) Superfamily putative [Albugo laibachii Nc14]|eukprot:CCA26515.1 ATPbinding Cassette (ABC) Superfamily putative [Albugo laibachii Nc14]
MRQWKYIPLLSAFLLPFASSLRASAQCDPEYEYINASGACECKPGFQGWGCRMCTSTETCRRNLHDKRVECVQDLIYRNDQSVFKTYSCHLAQSIASLLSDGALAIRCNRTSANCSVAIYKLHETLAKEHYIDCHLTGCAFTNGSADGICRMIQCRCGKACSTITKGIVDKLFNNKSVKMLVQGSHNLTLEIKDSPIPLQATCNASACEYPGSGGSGSGGGAWEFWDRHKALLIGSTVAIVLGSICWCISCFFSRTDRKDTKKYHQILQQEFLDNTLRRDTDFSFQIVSCKANIPASKQNQTFEKTLLSNVSGRYLNGQMLGILGPSGSGKTTLLNALAAVDTESTKTIGEIKINGENVSRNYRKIAAYVHQDDSLFPMLTVRECISYSAQLRLPSFLESCTREELVSNIIRELQLDHIANSRIGSTRGDRGISGGERRRVSIGMELVTSPWMIFLDEPTSGLDSASANSVVQLLKTLASHGRIVIMSIHQPSSKSFMSFDQILVLAKGQALYQGQPQLAKTHFQSLGYKYRTDESIPDYILDVATAWSLSKVPRKPLIPSKDLELQSGTQLPSEWNSVSTNDAESQQENRLWLEFRVLFWRTGVNLLRERSLFRLHLFLSTALGLIGGLIFSHVTNDLAGFQNRSGAFYFILTFFGFSSMSSMDLFQQERPIFMRETGAMYYGAFAYFAAKAWLDTVLLRVVPAFIFGLIFYWIMGLQASLARFLPFLATIILFNVASGSISILISVLTRSTSSANLMGTVVFLIMLLFGGFLLNSQTMPVEVAWIKHFSIFNYGFEILLTNELHRLIFNFDAPGYPAVPVYGDVFLRTLGMDYANIYYDFITLGLLALGLQLLAFLFLLLQVPTPSRFPQHR